MQRRFAKLYIALGHSFVRPELLDEALTHASAAAGSNGQAAAANYERMEFLGDRVLNLVVAQHLLKRYPDEKVGQLARRHAALVREEALADVSRRAGIAEYIRLSTGEELSGGRANPAIMADCCEAVIAALYLDGGFKAAERFIAKYWTPLLNQTPRPPKDPKTALQEWAQSRGLPLPSYVTVAQSGPDHDPTFTVRVQVKGYPAANASGKSKRLAEQIAAQFLLAMIAGQLPPRENGTADKPAAS
ncbi:MAG: ribonuclease III [Rhodospirillaceae bacterium]|nr:ribonuclease III [Rhodospirillaceae bacterium]